MTAFEQVDPGEGPYGLVVAAQSFHWTDPDTRWARLVELLAPDGAAAMFWNNWSLDPAANDVDGIREVYRHYGPDLTPDLARSGPSCWPADEIEATPGLVDSIERSYGWEWNLPAARCLRLMATTSQYAVLTARVRSHLFNALREVSGDHVPLLGETQLNLTRKVC